MEHAYEWVRDARDHAQQHRDPVKNKRFVLIIMKFVESQLNAGIVGQNPPNRIEGETHLVSSVIVNNVQRSKYFNETLSLLYPWVQVGLPELENLTENVNMHDLFDQSRGIWVLKHQRITENVDLHSLPTSQLGEDMIIIRYIVSLRQPQNTEIGYSTQIIWNSRFSWRQILHHLEGNTYDFNFEPELMVIATNYFGEEAVSGSPLQIVERLPDVIIGQHHDDMCSVCHEKFESGERSKILACTHIYHSHCILKWFKIRVSCPTCRSDSP